MSKVKPKKQNVFIDMTAMSDVTVLLLTFFMLTSTFLPQAPVQVNTPASVMEIKVPDYDVINILIDLKGQVYVNIDNEKVRMDALDRMSAEYGVSLNAKQKKAFLEQPYIGAPMNRLAAVMDLPMSEQDAAMKQVGGIPTDSVNNQLARWIVNARALDESLKITLKADQMTPYPLVSKVMKTLVDVKANRYSLVTTLKGMPAGF